MLHRVLAVGILLTGCSTSTLDDTGDPDSDSDTVVQSLLPTSCEFDDIAGVWQRPDDSSPFPNTFVQLELFDGEEGDVVGETSFVSDIRTHCVFEVTCVLSELEGYDYVYNTAIEGEGGCLDGGYHLRLQDDALEVTYNPLRAPDRLGPETSLFTRAE